MTNDRNMGNIGTANQSNLVSAHGIFNNNINEEAKEKYTRRCYMRKEVIFTELDPVCRKIVFLYKGTNVTYELFRTKYRATVHEFFRYGKSIEQLHNDKGWRKSRFLSNLIEGRL